MGQNLGRCKTQTATHTPIGRNGADSMGRRFGAFLWGAVTGFVLCWGVGHPTGTGTAVGVS